MNPRCIGYIELFDRVVQGDGVYFKVFGLFWRPGPETAQEYDQFFEMPRGIEKWTEHHADEIVGLFTNAATVIHDMQEEQRGADLATMKKWGRFGRWLMRCARWQPHVVQTKPEIVREMAQQCYEMVDLFERLGKTKLMHKARTVAKKLQKA